MERFCKNALITIMLITISGVSWGQETKWSLEKCIKHAMENNLQIKQKVLQSKLNESAYTQSRASLFPTLRTSASHQINSGRALDETTYQFTKDQTIQSDNFQVSSNLTIFSGFQKMNSIKKAKLDLMASIKDTEKTKNDIAVNIASAYLNILFNKDILKNSKNQLDIIRQQEERTKKLVDAGSLPQGNLLEIQAQVAAEELNVVTYTNQLNLAYLSLVQILELESFDDFEIEEPDLTIEQHAKQLYDVAQSYNLAVANLPEIESAKLKLESQEKELKIAKGGYYPSLTLGAGLNTRYSGAQKTRTVPDLNAPLGTRQIGIVEGSNTPVISFYQPTLSQDYGFADQFKDNMSYYVGFTLSVPIFNGLSAKSRVARTKINVEQTRLQMETAKKDLLQRVQKAYYDAVAAIEKFKSSEKSVAAMQTAFRYTEEKYNVGMVNTLEYNQAKNKLIKAESDLLQAKYEYIFKTNILDFYRGNPLTLK
jgi:outer membrane protein